MITSVTDGKMINFFVVFYKLKYSQSDLILQNRGVVRFW